jgi:tRNA A37 threonylcarbamoyladenosine dehydratase
MNQLNRYPKESYEPRFFKITDEKSKTEFFKLLEERKPVIIDEIFGQVKELVKCLNPSVKYTNPHLEEDTTNYLNGIDMTSYGTWVYYPWSNRMIHLLDESDFIKVRTNRNHYKISPDEQSALATKKIGLIGLSVGQSVALALAMERAFGELRLADFDELELTNLNRIRTGLHNLGINKAISVAREIMEIDPYLKVTCFEDGLTEENMDEFFSGGGKLDLLIDECDGLDIKVLCRYKARELGIPVVMEASDRGMVDVERFDLEPQRPLLHGLIDDLDPKKLKSLKTNEDKIPYMLAIVGAETISDRAKASMLEIGESITTWPQLASAVALGGGITADVVRRIFLNSFSSSGRYYVDVEEIIGDQAKAPNLQVNSNVTKNELLNFGPELELVSHNDLPKNVVERIQKAACHAPSGGNLQPWRWTYSRGCFQLYNNSSLRSDFLDHNNIATHIAMGASLENASLASIEEGYDMKASLFPVADNPSIIAHAICERSVNPNEIDLFLAQNIFNRETNRNIESSESLSAHHKDLLKSYALKNGSKLILIDDSEQKAELGKIIAMAEQLRIMHPMGHKNFVDEMRWSDEEAHETRDGIDIATCDLTVGELTGFRLARSREVIELLDEWNGGSAFQKLSLKSTESAAALGIITREDKGPDAMIKAGRDMERVWIGANANGIGFQPQSPLTLILERLEKSVDLNEEQVNLLTQARSMLESILEKEGGGNPYFIFRLFYGKKPVVRSLRRETNFQFRIQE